jgi:hypothetical protein
MRTLHALASAAIHGRKARGIDLLLGGARVSLQARRLGVLILERLCDPDEERGHMAAALMQMVRIEHAANFGGTATATTDVMARQAFGHIEAPLRPNIDYWGEGTKEDPFRFGAHLQFHQASRTLLKEIGLDVGKSMQMLDDDAAGRLCDRWTGPERDYWVLIPLPSR